MDKKSLPDWKLERYLLGELPAGEMEDIGRRLEHDQALRDRVRELRESDRAILERYPAGVMAERIRQRALYMDKDRPHEEKKRSPNTFNRIVYSLAAIATAAVVVFIASPFVTDRNPGHRDVPVPESIRLKGMKPGVFVYRKTADGASELLKNGDRVSEGDVLQTAYVAIDYRFGVILSVDGRGAVTVHFPPGGRGATALELNKKVVLGRAYRLDDAPHFERFFFVTSTGPPDVAGIVRKARALAADPGRAAVEMLPLGGGSRQYSIMLIKGGTP